MDCRTREGRTAAAERIAEARTDCRTKAARANQAREIAEALDEGYKAGFEDGQERSQHFPRRVPVAQALTAGQHEQGRINAFVVCADGSYWRWVAKEWVEEAPIPGSQRALELGQDPDEKPDEKPDEDE